MSVSIRIRILIGIAVIGLAMAMLSSDGKSVQARSAGDPLTLSRDDLRDYALREFHQLTTGKVPAWEDRKLGWRDQCDVDLAEGSCKGPGPITGPESKRPQSNTPKATTLRPLTEDSTIAFHLEHSLRYPSEFHLTKQGEGVQSLTAITKPSNSAFPAVLQTIYFNRSAVAALKNSEMSVPAALDLRRKNLEKRAASLSDMQVKDFSSNAVVVKTFWELVHPVKMDDFPGMNYATGAHLYNSGMQPDSKTGVLSILFNDQFPSNGPFVDLSKGTICLHTQVQDSKKIRHEVYTLGCFHFRPVHPAQVAQISQHASSASDIDPEDATLKCDGPPKANCYLIMVGVHVMTRETPNWLWMTYFWSSDWWGKNPNTSTVPNKWDLFKANATANNTDPVANPYLEGPFTGMYSNCMECHRHAIFHPGFGTAEKQPFLLNYVSGIAGVDINKPLPIQSTDPLDPDKIPARLRNLQSPSCYFAGALQTHFLWTIALHSASDAPKDSCPPPAH